MDDMLAHRVELPDVMRVLEYDKVLNPQNTHLKQTLRDEIHEWLTDEGIAWDLRSDCGETTVFPSARLNVFAGWGMEFATADHAVKFKLRWADIWS